MLLGWGASVILSQSLLDSVQHNVQGVKICCFIACLPLSHFFKHLQLEAAMEHLFAASGAGTGTRRVGGGDIALKRQPCCDRRHVGSAAKRAAALQWSVDHIVIDMALTVLCCEGCQHGARRVSVRCGDVGWGQMKQ